MAESVEELREIFLDRILETSDATYRHRLSGATHTLTALTLKYLHMQTHTYKHTHLQC